MKRSKEAQDSTKIAADKVLLRFFLREQRNRLVPGAETEAAFSRALVAEIGETPQPLTIAAFLPLGFEPPLQAGLKQLFERGHRLLVPVVLPQRQLGWVSWEPGVETRTNALGIAEPTGQRLGAQAFLEADVRLVPALALSTGGKRLGQGGGYYDRLFELLGEKAKSRSTLGIVFEREILDGLPADEWDAVLGYALTEEGVRPLGTEAGR